MWFLKTGLLYFPSTSKIAGLLRVKTGFRVYSLIVVSQERFHYIILLCSLSQQVLLYFSIAGTMTDLRCVVCNLEEDGESLRDEFSRYLGDMLGAMSDNREEEELSIMNGWSMSVTLSWWQNCCVSLNMLNFDAATFVRTARAKFLRVMISCSLVLCKSMTCKLQNEF